MYHTVTTIPTSNQKILKTGSIDTRNTRMRDRSLYYLGADTYMKRQDYASFVGRDADLAVSVLSFFQVQYGKCFCYNSGAPVFTIGFSRVSVARLLVFCVMFCR